MALQSCSTLSPQSVRSPPSLSCAARQQIALPSSSSSASSSSGCFGSNKNVVLRLSSRKRAGAGAYRTYGVRSSLETVGPTVGKVTEVNKDNFWPIVNAAGDKTVVLDMYTQWYDSSTIRVAP
ncbi:hypothetical protein TIFTF001_001183 [Ficus carica]|uniref:Uncharacterized protein n=1 Tax=Ficus carica TaxID=3494 RepID=A0AA87YXV7_FICCA|nr:hypothetical protein TIFTF001_001183 [Ficus carica]